MGGPEGSVIPAPAHHQPGVGGQTESAATCRTITSSSSARTRIEPIPHGRPLHLLPPAGVLLTLACFKPILEFPLFPRSNGRSSALIGAPPSSDSSEQSTNIQPLVKGNSPRPSHRRPPPGVALPPLSSALDPVCPRGGQHHKASGRRPLFDELWRGGGGGHRRRIAGSLEVTSVRPTDRASSGRVR